jgi:hypothetical protein
MELRICQGGKTGGKGDSDTPSSLLLGLLASEPRMISMEGACDCLSFLFLIFVVFDPVRPLSPDYASSGLRLRWLNFLGSLGSLGIHAQGAATSPSTLVNNAGSLRTK